MKRPRIFYLVVAWCCFSMLIQASYLTRPAKAHQAAGEPVPVLWTVLPLIALVFVVWETVGLFQARRFHRWFAVVFLSCWTVALVWTATTVLRRPTAKVVPAIVLFSVLVAFNLLSVWYLSRRTFTEFAVQFVIEQDKARHSRMMQKASQEKILDDIRK
jgi:hypothetical protein